jgi:hypothetical protein
LVYNNKTTTRLEHDLVEFKQKHEPFQVMTEENSNPAHERLVQIDLKIRSSQASSKFGVYKFLNFSEILVCNCALVFLEHHQLTQHG